ncbi:methylmalonyl Co-A mutase-associated GTPase MeaB [Halosimplex pelagicum]|uniref:Methylmalonyl Co-A mutase-associated GTPase MeaB n=1 Tax=Halosimplex pelagicum TaxID=869886 RepID=A0A7D5PBL1_9EURY|nr:methylmalonyl Co-A mutase-associated GTPase MeaB [Halosimplex pelagicum]QLH82585.1 methylmalonyl Co-A mutase-associated GTPase MeaB [Halosimplex pelagicum]
MTGGDEESPDDTGSDADDTAVAASAGGDTDDLDPLIADLLDGKHRALARTITKIENRSPGYRDLVSQLHTHTGDADVIGITGSPGAGKSTLVDKLAATYREEGLTVGVIAIDPASPFTGGAVLGDRIRMASNVGDMDVFFRSMSARGTLGGLSTATTDAVKALDAFGKDKVIVETVGAGQNEVDIVRTADTVVVLVPPGSGDDVQMLKAGILEIADLFVVNKADLDGADRTVSELREMLQLRDGEVEVGGHHGFEEATVDVSGEAGRERGGGGDAAGDDDAADDADAADDVDAEGVEPWDPPIVETVANRGEGIDDLIAAMDDHRAYLVDSGRLESKARTRYAEEIRTLLREDARELLAEEIDARGGLDERVDAVLRRETDPYTVAEEVLEPLADCVAERRESRE